MPSAAAPPKASFNQDLEALEQLAATPAISSTAIARALQEIYARVVHADFSQYDVAEISKFAPEIMYRLFDIRIGLRNRIPEFERRGLMTAAVIEGLRDCFRIIRYVTDMVGEVATGNERTTPASPQLAGFTGLRRNTLVNWAFANERDLNFRSGDVLLVRGEQHNSAAIARIGDVDSTFSHLCIVYIDESGGQHYVVESLIEEGAIVNTLTHALNHGLARAVLYRHKDAALAARAAKWVHDYVAASRTSFIKRIWYDFSMRLDNRRRLFCSKLVRLAYDKASNGACVLPRYPTQISMHNKDFLRRIGVKTHKTFAPGDIDMDSRFELVCEWQDYRKTSKVRLQDFTMDKLLDWMELGYKFRETPAIWAVSVLGRVSAHFSDWAKDMLSSIAPKVPINMRRKTVATVAMLHKTAEPIYREMQKLDDECVRENGRPMHGEEIYAALEKIRLREGKRIGYLEM